MREFQLGRDLLSLRTAGTQDLLYIESFGTAGQIYVYWTPSATGSSSDSVYLSKSATSPAANPIILYRWQQLMLTFTPLALNATTPNTLTDTRMQLYLDTVQILNVTSPGVFPAQTRQAVLGNYIQFRSTSWWPDAVAKCEFYDFSLSQQLIQQLFAAQIPRSIITAQITGAVGRQLVRYTITQSKNESLNPQALVYLNASVVLGGQSSAQVFNLSSIANALVNATLPSQYNVSGFTLSAFAQSTCNATSETSSVYLSGGCDPISPCRNGGVCKSLSLKTFLCICPCGWAAQDNCTVPATAASRNCTCEFGLNSQFCNQTDFCALGVCLPPNQCANTLSPSGASNYTCKCLNAGYSGANGTLTNACLAFSACAPNSSCLLSLSGLDYSCQCNATMIGRNCTVAAPTSISSCNDANSLLPVYSLDFSAPMVQSLTVNYTVDDVIAGSSHTGLASLPLGTNRIQLIGLNSSPSPSAAARALGGLTTTEAVGLVPWSQFRFGFTATTWYWLDVNVFAHHLYDWRNPTGAVVLNHQVGSALSYTIAFTVSPLGDTTGQVKYLMSTSNRPILIHQ